MGNNDQQIENESRRGDGVAFYAAIVRVLRHYLSSTSPRLPNTSSLSRRRQW